MTFHDSNGETHTFFGRLSSRRRTDADLRTEAAAPVETGTPKEPTIQHAEGVAMVMLARQANLLVEAFEGEIKGAVGAAVKDGEAVDEAARAAIAAVNQVSEQAGVVNQASEATVANVQSVASATEELASSEREVTNLVHRAENLASSAVEKATHASNTVSELAEASKAINGIVVFIEDLARRTNMLALNASIEAQRAGAAGKGFAVVAGEVKDLAKQTASATRDIREKIAGIQKTADEAGGAIGVIASAVGEIQTINGEVAASVTQQAAATNEISRNAQEASARVSEVTDSIGSIASGAKTALDLSIGMEKSAETIAVRLRDMRHRLGVVVDASRGSKRSLERIPLDLPVQLVCDGRKVAGTLMDIALDAGCFRPDEPLTVVPETAAIDLPWLGMLGGSARLEGGVVFVTFRGLSDEVVGSLRKLIEHLEIIDVDMLAVGEQSARQAKEAFEKAIDAGQISMSDLFDEDYQPVAGSNPQQFMTRFVEVAERVLPAIQDPPVAANPRIVAICAVDRNGYLPMNQAKVSQPQGSDPAWNAANSRNRRLLNDPVGLAAGRNQEKFIVQTYIREVGMGNWLLLKDLAIPIFVKGRHWGNMRLTYKS